ncbi:centrosomal protein of 290 kDa-like [Achroia grisella]|uniref:centrosomal protein of 290 kDa-like n=1 Tax=Achroia grisella TaxID=688607 RepID=UPI0027D23957|nr:centrosomal protein of 290 kDa-like [Achroia grisella]
MPENIMKIPQSAPPVARAGAGDISERELSRERHKLTTPTRIQPAHPKKKLFSTPVSKFTAKSCAPSPNLQRIRSCLNDYKSRTPNRAVKIGPKAVSMEDLTPTKRIKRERIDNDLPALMSPGLHTAAEVRAAARIGKFLMLSAWRRRREEVRCLRKTLEFQVSCSERLRIQVSTLKSLLDSDNAKVRMAMRELERLKQRIKDKDMEKVVLEREKMALEKDVCAAQDQASEMSIGWRNCRNELEGALAAAAAGDHVLALERAAANAARAQRDHAYSRLSMLEDEVSEYEALLSSVEEEAAALRRDVDEKQLALQHATEKLQLEQQAQERSSQECVVLEERVSLANEECSLLREQLATLRRQQGRLAAELVSTREQLDWWPRPLTRLLGAARRWLRRPLSLREAVLWSLVPARHGC